MDLERLEELFELYENNGEFLKFERVENKKSLRPDLHAFILLDDLVPGKIDMITAAEHDEIWLHINPEDLCCVITEEQVRELVRCGVRYSDESLTMFV